MFPIASFERQKIVYHMLYTMNLLKSLKWLSCKCSVIPKEERVVLALRGTVVLGGESVLDCPEKRRGNLAVMSD